MKHLLSLLTFIAAAGVSAVGAQAQQVASPPPPGTITIEPSTAPTRPPPQDNAVAPAPGIAPTQQNGDTKVEVDLRAPRIRCGDKTGEGRDTCLREMQAEDEIRLPADVSRPRDAGGMARNY
ncbi:MAG TPA: hypothetical protein VMM27_09690 [Casimicrobiaceae bacterium]|nr:hypothetical protein [Casimicrobiaceae bacterium]